MNIAKNLERARTFFPDKSALIFEEKSYTYRELDENVNRLAGELKKLGIEKGDRVILFLPNIPGFIIGYFAVQKLGAIAVSANAMLKRHELEYIVNDADAKVLLTTESQRQEVIDEDLPSLKHVIIVEGKAGGKDFCLEEMISGADPSFRTLETDGNDPAAILYTSGTTGFPKGVVLTQSNISSNSFSASHYSGYKPDDKLHLFLPLFHCFGQNYILNGGISKCSTIILHRRFDPEEVLTAISKEKVTHFFAVPTIYIYFLNMDTSAYDLSSLRYCFTAAASMPLEIATAWKEKFGLTIHEGYGLTECSPFAAYNHEYRHKPGSIGTPVENVDMKIVDEAGNELPPGEHGEIIIRGPNVMLEYWRKPEATAEAIQNGWLRSGDIGMMDEEGYFFITDRLKDMINTGGFKVFPNEVEQIIYRHPAVNEAAVFGVTDPVKGESVQAAIVLKKNSDVSPEELLDFCKKNMAAYRVPRKIFIVDQLPKSATGKILKRVLKDQ